MIFDFSHRKLFNPLSVLLWLLLLPGVQGADLFVSGEGGIVLLDGESGELRREISADAAFTSIRVGPGGDLFALHPSTGTIHRFARPDFDFAGHFASGSFLEGAAGFTFDSTGRLVAAKGTVLYRFDETATSPVQSIDLHGPGMRVMAGIATGPDHFIHTSCQQTGRIYRVDLETETVTRLADRFGVPRGIAFDNGGALLAADAGMTPALVRLAGDDRFLGGFFPKDLPPSFELQQPFDVAVAPDGRIVVADRDGNRLLRFDSGLRFIDTPGEDGAAWQQPRSVAFSLPPIPIESFYDWQQAHFSPEELDDDSISGPNGNPTGDGKANLLRYGLGAGPWEPVDDRLPVRWTEMVDEQEFLYISFIRARDLGDVEVKLEVSNDLKEWAYSPDRLEVVQIEELDDTERLTYRDSIPIATADRHFVRIRVLYTQETN